MNDYPHSTRDVANAIGCHRNTVLKRAKELKLGIEVGGSAGFRFSDADKVALIESMRPVAAAETGAA